MRSIKEVNRFKMKPGCYYKMMTLSERTWLFEFKSYDGSLITSGEFYCVESNFYSSEISWLCAERVIVKNSLCEISLSEFNSISGREV